MTTRISVLLLQFALVATAAAAPKPALQQSIRQNIASFLGSHFDSSSLCPLPPPVQTIADNPADWRLGSISLSLSRWNQDQYGANQDVRTQYIELCLSDLQNFLANQHLDASVLQDLKSWISRLPVDPEVVQNFEAWLEKQNFCPSSGDTGSSDANRTDTAAGFTESPAEVPEPSTISTVVLGIGLLGGVLLRVRSNR